MKVKIITGKYKAADETWYKTGEIAELPDLEAMAAIAANVAIMVESPTVQRITEPVSEIASRVRGGSKSVKEE